MKLLFLFLMMGFSPPESRVDRFPMSNSQFSGCDAREVASGILTGERVPRKILYHYGKKEMLMKDIAEGTIPESDWNDYIMGEKTRFKLKRFRRGFYGTEYAEDADRFGDSTYNWLVEIKLKPECLKSSRVASLVYLSKNQEFQKWYQSKTLPMALEQWKATCFDVDGYPRSKYFIDYKNPSETADFIETECEKVVAQYYEEQKFSVIQDHAGDLVRSWALRDRDCIEKIEGSEVYWVKTFANREELWINTCNRERNHRNNIRTWFVAIESAGIDMETAANFSKMIKKIHAPEDLLDWETQEIDRFAAQDFADAFSAAVIRCSSRPKILKETLGKIGSSVDQLQSIEVKDRLEKLCR